MKSPFRQQASDYDCVPTTFLNAVSHLFERSEIPPLVVQRIYHYCFDSLSSHQSIGHGTSGLAVQLLGNWLNSYRHKKFHVNTVFSSGSAVHFDRGSKIVEYINRNGLAVLKVTSQRGTWHCILGLEVKNGWLYCYDPYARSPRANKTDKYEFLLEDGFQSPNLRINCSWLEAYSNGGRYHLGKKPERECLLLERIPG
jgi:hypothetical protein